MAIFRHNYTADTPVYCPVCRNRNLRGVRLHTADTPVSCGDSYAAVLPPIEVGRAGNDAYICKRCYQRFFGEQGKIESLTLSAALRPAAIHPGERRAKELFVTGMIRISAALLLLSVMLGLTALWAGDFPVFHFAAWFCALASGAAALFAALQLIRAFLCGVDTQRRIALGIQLGFQILLTVVIVLISR